MENEILKAINHIKYVSKKKHWPRRNNGAQIMIMIQLERRSKSYWEMGLLIRVTK